MTEWGAYILWWRHRVLYVGKGHDGAHDRYRAHRRRLWGPLITHREWIAADPNTEQAAYNLEARLITELRPLANIAQQRRRGRRFKQIMNQATSAANAPTETILWRYWPAAPIVAALALAVAAKT